MPPGLNWESSSMDNLLKGIACIMLVVLLSTQLLLRSPYRPKLTDDSLNGRALNTYETLLYKGTVLLDAFGNYSPNSSAILLNGEPVKIVDVFPVELEISDGDVVEVQLKRDAPSFYIYLSSQKGRIATDIKESTIKVKPGVNRLFKVLAKSSPIE